jgi:predicted membrane protein
MIKLKNIPNFHNSFRFLRPIFTLLIIVVFPIFLILGSISQGFRLFIYKLYRDNIYNNPDLEDVFNVVAEDSPVFNVVLIAISMIWHVVAVIISISALCTMTDKQPRFSIVYDSGKPVSVLVREPYCAEVKNKNNLDFIFTVVKDTYLMQFNYLDRCGANNLVSKFAELNGHHVSAYKPKDLVNILNSKEFQENYKVEIHSKEPQPE